MISVEVTSHCECIGRTQSYKLRIFSSPRLHIIVSGKSVRIYKHQAGSIVCVDTVDSIII